MQSNKFSVKGKKRKGNKKYLQKWSKSHRLEEVKLLNFRSVFKLLPERS